MTTCPICSQPLPEMRLGVRFTPLKARIFDAIKRGGQDGIEMRELHSIMISFSQRDKPISRHSIWSHLSQINSMIEDTNCKIVGSNGTIRLVKGKCNG